MRPDREPAIADAVCKLQQSRPVEVERELRAEYGMPPLVARAVTQEAMKRLRRDGGAIYQHAQASRIPGAGGRYLNPQTVKDHDN